MQTGKLHTNLLYACSLDAAARLYGWMERWWFVAQMQLVVVSFLWGDTHDGSALRTSETTDFQSPKVLATTSDDIRVSRDLFKTNGPPLTSHDTQSTFVSSELGFRRVKLSHKDDNAVFRIWQFAAWGVRYYRGRRWKLWMCSRGQVSRRLHSYLKR